MPTPRKDETEDEFVERCIPIVIEEGTAEDGDQASAICHSMWEQHKEENDKMTDKKTMFKIKNATEEIAEIWIYEMIGEDWWSGEGVTAKQFQKELAKVKSSKIDLHINSPGGDVFDGNAIYNLLISHPAEITTHIDGLAASAASVVALAGDKVLMAENALFMLHQPFAFTLGNEEDHEKTLEVLRQIGGSIAKVYSGKTKKEEDEIRQMMRDETWLNSDEALEAGFVDEIVNKIDMAACAEFGSKMAKMGYKKIPEPFNLNQAPTAKEAEKALRDVGFSIKEAKTILSKGLSDGLRDVDTPDDLDQEPDSPRDVEKRKPIINDRTLDLLLKADLASQ